MMPVELNSGVTGTNRILTWTTEPLWLKEGGTYYWYQNDHLGTPQKLVAQDGTVVWSAQYQAFGKATIDVNTVENPLRFPGQYEDAETGLLYNFHRYYDPRIGRYLRVDPIGLMGKDINFYGYGGSNPGKFFDPTGLQINEYHPPCLLQSPYGDPWYPVFDTAGLFDSASLMLLNDKLPPEGILNITSRLLYKLRTDPVMDNVRERVAKKIARGVSQEIADTFIEDCCENGDITTYDSDSIADQQFGGKRTGWNLSAIQVALNELTWIVRTTEVHWEAKGTISVSCDEKKCDFTGGLQVRFYIADPFDLRPDKDPHSPHSPGYDEITTVLGNTWHDSGIPSGLVSSMPPAVKLGHTIPDKWRHVADWNERLGLSGIVTCSSPFTQAYRPEWSYSSSNRPRKKCLYIIEECHQKCF